MDTFINLGSRKSGFRTRGAVQPGLEKQNKVKSLNLALSPIQFFSPSSLSFFSTLVLLPIYPSLIPISLPFTSVFFPSLSLTPHSLFYLAFFVLPSLFLSHSSPFSSWIFLCPIPISLLSDVSPCLCLTPHSLSTSHLLVSPVPLSHHQQNTNLNHLQCIWLQP